MTILRHLKDDETRKLAHEQRWSDGPGGGSLFVVLCWPSRLLSKPFQSNPHLPLVHVLGVHPTICASLYLVSAL